MNTRPKVHVLIVAKAQNFSLLLGSMCHDANGEHVLVFLPLFVDHLTDRVARLLQRNSANFFRHRESQSFHAVFDVVGVLLRVISIHSRVDSVVRANRQNQ